MIWSACKVAQIAIYIQMAALLCTNKIMCLLKDITGYTHASALNTFNQERKSWKQPVVICGFSIRHTLFWTVMKIYLKHNAFTFNAGLLILFFPISIQFTVCTEFYRSNMTLTTEYEWILFVFSFYPVDMHDIWARTEIPCCTLVGANTFLQAWFRFLFRVNAAYDRLKGLPKRVKRECVANDNNSLPQCRHVPLNWSYPAQFQIINPPQDICIVIFICSLIQVLKLSYNTIWIGFMAPNCLPPHCTILNKKLSISIMMRPVKISKLFVLEMILWRFRRRIYKPYPSRIYTNPLSMSINII